jgi:hypothetical protein
MVKNMGCGCNKNKATAAKAASDKAKQIQERKKAIISINKKVK